MVKFLSQMFNGPRKLHFFYCNGISQHARLSTLPCLCVRQAILSEPGFSGFSIFRISIFSSTVFLEIDSNVYPHPKHLCLNNPVHLAILLILVSINKNFTLWVSSIKLRICGTLRQAGNRHKIRCYSHTIL